LVTVVMLTEPLLQPVPIPVLVPVPVAVTVPIGGELGVRGLVCVVVWHLHCLSAGTGQTIPLPHDHAARGHE